MSEHIIFDALNTKLCTAPFMAAKVLLKKLFIANQTIYTKNNDIGFENYAFNPEAFAERFAFILSSAGKNGETIVTLENSSLYSLQYAKNYIENNTNAKLKIEKKLNAFELTAGFLAKITHVNRFLLTKEVMGGISKNIKQTLENFKAAVYIGPDLEFDPIVDSNLNELLSIMKLSRVYFDKQLYPSGYSIYSCIPEVAMKMAGAILSDAFDSGADFIIADDIRTFFMFDTCRKKIEKTIGRQIPLYVLTMPQIVLLALGEQSKKVLGFDAHKVKPTLLK
jgi:succinate dehydrogenase / fumarate reductase cytochrome b subunit